MEQKSVFEGVTFHLEIFNKSIPIKDNLVHRGVTVKGVPTYSGGCGKEELINHLFLRCDFLDRIWYLIHQWLCISTITPIDGLEHALQFGGSHVFWKEICFRL